MKFYKLYLIEKNGIEDFLVEKIETNKPITGKNISGCPTKMFMERRWLRSIISSKDIFEANGYKCNHLVTSLTMREICDVIEMYRLCGTKEECFVEI